MPIKSSPHDSLVVVEGDTAVYTPLKASSCYHCNPMVQGGGGMQMNNFMSFKELYVTDQQMAPVVYEYLEHWVKYLACTLALIISIWKTFSHHASLVHHPFIRYPWSWTTKTSLLSICFQFALSLLLSICSQVRAFALAWEQMLLQACVQRILTNSLVHTGQIKRNNEF